MSNFFICLIIISMACSISPNKSFSQQKNKSDTYSLLARIENVLDEMSERKGTNVVSRSSLEMLEAAIDSVLERNTVKDILTIEVLKRFKSRNRDLYNVKARPTRAIEIVSYQNTVHNYQNDLLHLRQNLLMNIIRDSINIKLDTFSTIIQSLPDIQYVRIKVDSILSAFTSFNSLLDSATINIYLRSKLGLVISSVIDSLRINKPGPASLPKKIIPRNYAGIGAYSNSVYSGYYFRSFKNKSDSITWVAGPEILFPIKSPNVKSVGAFLNTGMITGHLLLHVGVGWINTTLNNDLSWKCGLIYIPSKIGMGIGYSPLTGFGANLLISFK